MKTAYTFFAFSLFLFLVCSASAQTYTQIGPAGNYYCVTFGNGTNKLTQFGSTGYNVVSFAKATSSLRTQARTINQSIALLRNQLKNASIPQQARIQRVIAAQKSKLGSVNYSIKGVSNCQHGVKLPVHGVPFTFLSAPYPDGSYWMGGAYIIVDPVIINLGHGNSIRYEDGSNWCLGFTGTYEGGGTPFDAAPGTEFYLQFHANACDQVAQAPSPCPIHFANKQIGYPFFVSGLGLSKDLVLNDAAAYVGTLSLTARPMPPQGCNK